MTRSQYWSSCVALAAILALLLILGRPTPIDAGPVEWLLQQYRTNRTFPRLNRAYKLLAQKKYPQARKLLEKALAIDPDNDEIREQLLNVCYQLKDYGCAHKHAAFLMGKYPHEGRYLLLLGQIAMEQDRSAEVIRLFDRPGGLTGMAGEQLQAAQRLLASALIRQGKYDKALDILRTIAHPGYFELYTQAISQQHVDDRAAAIDSLKQAYAAATTFADKRLVALDLATLYLRQKDSAQALTTLTTLQRDFPDHAWDRRVLDILIPVAIRNDRMELARRSMQAYRLRYHPDAKTVEHWINALAERQQYKLALNLIAEQSSPCQQAATQSVILEKIGKFQEAADSLLQCAREIGSEPSWQRIANLYHKAGQTDRELDALWKGLDANPDDPVLLSTLLDRLVAQKRFDEANRLLGRMRRKGIGDSQSLLQKQVVLLESGGQYAEAAALVQQQLKKRHLLAGDPLVQQYMALVDHLSPRQRIRSYLWLLDHLRQPSYFVLSTVINMLDNQHQQKQILEILERYYPFGTFSMVQQQEFLALMASSYYRFHMTAEAEKILNQLQQRVVQDPHVLERLAHLYASQKNCAKGLAMVKRYLRIHPLAIRPRMLAGYCYLSRKMPGLAVHALEIVRRHPKALTRKEQQRLELNLAFAYSATHAYAKALPLFEHHFEENGDPVSALKAAAMALNLHRLERARFFLGMVQPEGLTKDNLYDYLVLQGDLATAQDDYHNADHFYFDALALKNDGSLWYRWAKARYKLGELEDAIQGTRKALALDPDNGVWAAFLAYLEVAAHRDQEAVPWFKKALAAHPDQLKLHEDLGYAHKRLGANQQAIASFKRMVDNAPFFVYHSREEEERYREKIFRIRREIAEMDRRFFASFGLSANLLSDDTNLFSRATPINAPMNTGYGELLLGYQPPGIGYRNGSLLQVTGRLLWGMDSGALFPDSDTYQLAVGLKYKPFGAVNLVVSGERFIKGGDASRDDWFIRVSGSLDRGVDWQPVASRWLYYSGYIEGGWFLDADTGLATGQLRAGQGYKLNWSQPLAVIPYGLAGFSWNNDNEDHKSLSRFDVGLGVALWHWCNQSRYKAYQTKNELGLELRQPVGGNDDANTSLLLRLSTKL